MTEKKASLKKKMSISTTHDTRPRLIIGLDFGTTWSGIAWGLESCPGDVEVIQSWPGDGNKTTEKVPTLLAYRDSKLAWGHQVDHPGNRLDDTIEGVKLLLDEKQIYRFEPASHSKQIIKKMNKTPVDVVADYLERLVAHLMEVLNRRFSTALQTMELRYILTVPAVWSDKAKDATLRAAHMAKIPASALTLLAEPEAAAVYAIQTIQPNSIKDIITYRITQTEPLRFSEVTEGTGAVCGSVMLDVRFEELLRRIYQDEYSHEIPQGALNVACRYWQDYIKPTYRGPVDETEFAEMPYRVSLPGAAIKSAPSGFNRRFWSKESTIKSGTLGFDGGFWYMEREQVKEIFDPIVKQIEALIADQVVQVKGKKLSVKVGIILVGGLGSSEYLYQCLRTTFDGIEVMQPKNAWSAVVRYGLHIIYFNRPSANGNSGAVNCGQEGNQVDNRMARCNYGINHSHTLGCHKPKTGPSRWCPYEETWKRDDYMNWYITKVRITTLKGTRFACTCTD
ncbi:unnamed protein product [Penicillium salamii]|uniref:Uncharacterized protein n=1 Tax=Penicillium salamii TaxID=1612424 RepID=A0A9W4JZ37_9EURO|nr:unnamed protein product [Penicillium salamii]CAG8319983.1 unnamed protein product [Penicillium salamii]CAG8401004.1 unnamed protein product [Penicillium salamii]CAG8427566.1 unnamed protein product [Penicillium salamii]